MKTIAFVVGSIRQGSLNQQLAVAVSHLLPADYEAVFADLSQLPMYNQDNEAPTLEAVLDFKKVIAASDAVIFVTPEYNRSIPALLKNAIDHGSRPYGSSVWQGKPAGILGTSPGALGTALAQQHLRNILSCLNMPVMSQPDVYLQYHDNTFDTDGHITNDSTKAYLEGWVNQFVEWVKHNG
ncbi:NADPH-dependent FMN reductase [Wohlfahrtiimonas chitiniclastica]|uniref:NADPH-dependent FMN reductase n=1 Tax=Wohlfahrtiimonas chitiniclastica TaxID=400946 RepID=UPI001BD0AF98|nr:NAD(P)H-dependent oxidoreductase [Wohlfahrtiimonas chitiniclastica]